MTWFDFLVRIIIAILFGSFIGLERQLKGHPAGIHANALVSFGSSLFVLFSILINAPDPTRIAAQIVTGVGFLCSGIIFKEGVNVRGINTAATIWCTAAIGILTGSGYLLFALMATVLLVFSNIILKPMERKVNSVFRFQDDEKYYTVYVTCTERKELLIRSMIMNYISDTKLILTDLESNDVVDGKARIMAKFICYGKRKDDVAESLISKISEEPEVTSVRWELM